MRLALLLALMASGCSIVDHVQVLPVINPMSNDVSCCVAYFEASKATSGSLEVRKGAVSWSVSAKIRHSF